MALHFVGFSGDEYTRAVRIFGPPVFIHLGWDVWARQEVMLGDVAAFARVTFEEQPFEHSFPDIKES